MSMNPSEIDHLQRVVASSLHEHWRLLVVEGIVLLVLGDEVGVTERRDGDG